MEDPWILPTLSPLSKPIKMDRLFPAAMIAYQANLECVLESSPSFTDGGGGPVCATCMGS